MVVLGGTIVVLYVTLEVLIGKQILVGGIRVIYWWFKDIFGGISDTVN